MNIFYGKCAGRSDVPAESSVEASLEAALEIFRGLEIRRGFMGINLADRHVLQLAPKKNGKIRVELLDKSIPAFDECEKDSEFAESLIRAAAAGHDVFQIARANGGEWEHLDLNPPAGHKNEDPVAFALRQQQARLATMQGPPKPRQCVTYPIASIASGDQHGLWVSIHFSSANRENDVLHIVGGGSKGPIYLERYDQMLSCYEGADRIEIRDGAITVTLNPIGEMALGLRAILRFTLSIDDIGLKAATGMFARMKQFESGRIIEFSKPL